MIDIVLFRSNDRERHSFRPRFLHKHRRTFSKLCDSRIYIYRKDVNKKAFPFLWFHLPISHLSLGWKQSHGWNDGCDVIDEAGIYFGISDAECVKKELLFGGWKLCYTMSEACNSVLFQITS
jgi:hypothetical protein